VRPFDPSVRSVPPIHPSDPSGRFRPIRLSDPSVRPTVDPGPGPSITSADAKDIIPDINQ
jgi:hypothetical protein